MVDEKRMTPTIIKPTSNKSSLAEALKVIITK